MNLVLKNILFFALLFGLVNCSKSITTVLQVNQIIEGENIRTVFGEVIIEDDSITVTVNNTTIQYEVTFSGCKRVCKWYNSERIFIFDYSKSIFRVIRVGELENKTEYILIL